MTRNQVAALLWVAGVGAAILIIVGGALSLREDYSTGPDDPEPESAPTPISLVGRGQTDG